MLAQPKRVPLVAHQQRLPLGRKLLPHRHLWHPSREHHDAPPQRLGQRAELELPAPRRRLFHVVAVFGPSLVRRRRRLGELLAERSVVPLVGSHSIGGHPPQGHVVRRDRAAVAPDRQLVLHRSVHAVPVRLDLGDGVPPRREHRAEDLFLILAFRRPRVGLLLLDARVPFAFLRLFLEPALHRLGHPALPGRRPGFVGVCDRGLRGDVLRERVGGMGVVVGRCVAALVAALVGILPRPRLLVLPLADPPHHLDPLILLRLGLAERRAQRLHRGALPPVTSLHRV